MNLRILTLIACIAGVFPASAADTIASKSTVLILITGTSPKYANRLTGVYPVSESGTISLPYLDTPLKAAGLSNAKLAVAIEAAYRDAGVYKSTSVQVGGNPVAEEEEQATITVGGQVRAPGPRRFTKGMTLFQAIASGGGATEFGSMANVKLTRDGQTQVVDVSKDDGKNLVVRANDTIEVAQKSVFGR